MIKIAICDDDSSVLNKLSTWIEKYRIERKLEIIYTVFQSPVELLAEMEKGISWDILFLDIIMPGENGIDVAKEIRQFDTKTKIIFLTSASEFAVESYTVDAYFYQLKPVLEDSFLKLLDLVIEECRKNEQNSYILKHKKGISRIYLDELMYCEVMGRKLQFYMKNGQVFEVYGSLEDVSEQLKAYDCFQRVHRSFLINMDFIQDISSKVIIMRNCIEIPIPHGKYTSIKDKYFDYMFH